MHVLYANAACCPASLESELEGTSSLSDVLDVLRPLAYHQECLVSSQRHKTTGQTVAVKSYVKARLSSLAKEQVNLEVFIHASMQHDHIVPLLAAAEDDRHVHLLMQWADAGDLRQHLTGISEQRLRDFVIRPLLQALAVLQAQGVVHRDIKPENVLVHRGAVRLADFGLAVHSIAETALETEMSLESQRSSRTTQCVTEPFSSMSSDTVSMSSSFAALDDLSTESGSELSHRPSGSRPPLPRPASTPDLVAGAGGTPMYAAPEVMRSMFSGSRKGEAVIPKNDVWAVGIIALEALTGCHPYSPNSTCVTDRMFSCNLLYAVAHHSGFRLPSHFSPDLTDFLRSALHVDPTQRPSAVDLLSHPWVQSVSDITPGSSAGAAGKDQDAAQPTSPSLRLRIKAEYALSTGLCSPRGSAGGAASPVSCKASVASANKRSTGGGGFPWDASGSDLCFEY